MEGNGTTKFAGLGLGLGSVLGVALLTLCCLTSCTKDEGSVTAYCSQLRRVPPLASVLTGFADEDPGQLSARLDDASASYARLAKEAPSEVRGDTEDTVALVDAVIAGVSDHGDDPEAAASAVRKAVKEHPDAAAAAAKVSAYAADKCKVVLNPTVPAGAGPTTTGPVTSDDGLTTTSG